MLEMLTLVQQCTPAHVSHEIMHQIVSVESAKRPHAIGYKLVRRVRTMENGREVVRKQVSTLTTQPKNVAEAIEWARYLQAQNYEFDAGAGQINSTNFAKYGLTIEAAFDPCKSIEVGAHILTDCYARAYERFRDERKALKAALSCYQSGNFETGFKTGYVQKVVAAPRTPSLPPR